MGTFFLVIMVEDGEEESDDWDDLLDDEDSDLDDGDDLSPTEEEELEHQAILGPLRVPFENVLKYLPLRDLRLRMNVPTLWLYFPLTLIYFYLEEKGSVQVVGIEHKIRALRDVPSRLADAKHLKACRKKELSLPPPES